MFNRFCKAQTLRFLFERDGFPLELSELVDAWEVLYQANIRGTLLGDSFAFEDSPSNHEPTPELKSTDLMSLTPGQQLDLDAWIETHDPELSIIRPLSHRVYAHDHVTRLGETFKSSGANSQVYYRDSAGCLCAGSIAGIFTHIRSQPDGGAKIQTFFTVNQYRPLYDDLLHLDQYRRNAIVAGKIYHNVHLHGSTLVSSSDLLYHFAVAPVAIPTTTMPCFVALPLDRS